MGKFLERHPSSKYLFTKDGDEKGPDRPEGTFSRCLRDNVWRKEECIELAPKVSLLDSNGWPSNIGTRSNHECPEEYAVNRGAHINKVEIRWRWKGQKGGRVVSWYVNMQQEYEDVKVAALLRHGGVVRYKVKDTVADAVLDAWL